MSPAVLPSEFDIEHYRDLSHRKTAMKVRALLGVFPGYLATDLDAARQIIDKRGMRLYAKSPWSCSGRGVMPLERMSVSAALSHVAGIIRRQGSVLLEEAWPQGTDIAALYVRRGETVEFNGWSMFESSPTGAYAGNIVASQQQLERMIGERTDIAALRDIATLTGHALEKVLTGCFYNGQLGVDMLIAPDGRVNPCIEVNLRRTMGFVARDIHNRLGIEGRLEMSAPPGATMLCPPRGSFSIGVTPRAGA